MIKTTVKQVNNQEPFNIMLPDRFLEKLRLITDLPQDRQLAVIDAMIDYLEAISDLSNVIASRADRHRIAAIEIESGTATDLTNGKEYQVKIQYIDIKYKDSDFEKIVLDEGMVGIWLNNDFVN